MRSHEGERDVEGQETLTVDCFLKLQEGLALHILEVRSVLWFLYEKNSVEPLQALLIPKVGGEPSLTQIIMAK